MNILMEALRTFTGREGFIKRGDRFYVRTYDRAENLSKHGLARQVTDEQGELVEEPQTPREQPQEQPQDDSQELLDQNPEEDQVQERPQYENQPRETEENRSENEVGYWGITYTRDGYQLPTGEEYSSFQTAKRELLELLQREAVQSISLIEPVEREIFDNPEDVEQVEEVNPEEEEIQTFEDEVEHLGGGWYQLPNGDKVQGKNQARKAWDKYLEGEK